MGSPIQASLQLTAAEDAALAASITSLALSDVRNQLVLAYNNSLTQLNLTNHIDAVMRAEGSDGALSYPTVVMARDEADWPYGKSNDDAGHIVNPAVEPIQTVRAGARVNGQCCDVSRTYLYESATQEMIDAYSAVLDTELAVIAEMAPGVLVSHLDGVVQSGLASYIARPDVTYSYFWGHAIGEFTIMEPLLSNETEPMSLTEDMILGIQIYLYFEAGWFLRLEDTCLVTATGVDVLSDAPKALDDIMLLQNSTSVDVSTEFSSYAYDSAVTVNATVFDSDKRTIDEVFYFDGSSWSAMVEEGANEFTRQYVLDHSFPSHVTSLVRAGIQGEFYYISSLLTADLTPTYEEVLDPIVEVVIEGVTTQDRMTWIFSMMGADMIQLHFLKVYPPPGDQFLVKDINGNVIAEYKWNLGAEAMAPWVPGNVAIVEVVPQWMSVYGGVNHFYFEVDVLGIYDPEATTTTGTSSETTSSSLTTSGPGTSSTEGTYSYQGPDPLLLTGLGAAALVVIAAFLRKKR